MIEVTGDPSAREYGVYGHDGVGNIVSDPGGIYTYTPFNLLETATVASMTTIYAYDGDNMRVRRLDGTRADFFFRGAGSEVLSEFGQAGVIRRCGWTRDYLYLGGRLVASIADPVASLPPVLKVSFTTIDPKWTSAAACSSCRSGYRRERL